MNKSARYFLFSVMVVVFLLTSCAPVPAATQDARLSQMAIDQSVALTVAAKEIQARDQQLTEQSATLTAIAQNAQMVPQQAVTDTPNSGTASGGEVTIPEGPESVTSTATSSPLAPAPAADSTLDPNAPTIKSIFPNNGLMTGGITVTITGTNFIAGVGHTQFYFGNQQATDVKCASTTQCTVKVPPQEDGTVTSITVKAVNAEDKSDETDQGDIFTYSTLDPNAPIINGIKPNGGPTTGGTEVIITGENFVTDAEGGTKFYFGPNEATNIICDSETECTVTSPPGTEGYVLVVAGVFRNGVLVESQHVEADDGTADDGFKYSTVPQNRCGVITAAPDTTPQEFYLVKKGESFDIKWIVKNTGERTWPAGTVFKYSGGVSLSTKTSEKLPAMKPNDTYTVKIDAVAPGEPGKYYMTWTVQGMGCNGYIAISVE